MKRVIALMVYLIPFLANSQQEGIKWTYLSSWQKVVEQAKKEDKYIFLDCYATWCQPCHLMDKEVYGNNEVGKALNDKFISVKVQMDRTKYDSDSVKKWFADAKWIATYYSVNAFPTFLFFAPDGKPLHKSIGYKNSEEFIALSKDALDPEKQYYSVLANYSPGKIDTSELKGLARKMKGSDAELGLKMALEYLTLIPKSELGYDDNLNLMIDFYKKPAMQRLVFDYLKTILPKAFSNRNHRVLIRWFSSASPIQNIVLDYLEKLSMMQLTDNLPLLQIFKDLKCISCSKATGDVRCIESRAKKIAERYINTLSTQKIYTQDMLFFIADFTKSSKDRGFKIFYQSPDKINTVVKLRDYAQSVTDNVIIEEEYNTFYNKAIDNNVDDVPWEKIAATVANKYNKLIAERLNIWVRVSLYEYFAEKKDKYWPEYIDYYIQKIEKIGIDTVGPMHQMTDVTLLNNFVYSAIFYHSYDKQHIETGLKWMEGVVRRNPTHANNIDTYANLLYKAGKKEDAVKWEEKALQIASTDKEQEHLVQSLKSTVAKMQRGEPTWIKDKED